MRSSLACDGLGALIDLRYSVLLRRNIITEVHPQSTL